MHSTTLQPTKHPIYFYRIADDNDGENIRQIIFDALSSYGLHPDPAGTDVDLYDIEKFYPNGTFWVITTDNNEIKGCFALYLDDVSTPEIRKMYFHPSIRTKGLGSWAMEFLLDKAKELGFTELTLETVTVLVEAISLYKKYGFETLCSDVHSARCDMKMKRSIV